MVVFPVRGSVHFDSSIRSIYSDRQCSQVRVRGRSFPSAPVGVVTAMRVPSARTPSINSVPKESFLILRCRKLLWPTVLLEVWGGSAALPSGTGLHSLDWGGRATR